MKKFFIVILSMLFAAGLFAAPKEDTALKPPNSDMEFGTKAKPKSMETDKKMNGKMKIAVLDLKNNSGYKIDTSAVAEWLQTELVNTKQFVIVERSQLDKVLNEQKVSLAGLSSDADAAKIGEMVGAQYILTGSISYWDGYYILNVKGIDSSTSIIEFADKIACLEPSELYNLMDDLAARIVKLSKGENVPAFDFPKKPANSPTVITGQNGQTIIINTSLQPAKQPETPFVFEYPRFLDGPSVAGVTLHFGVADGYPDSYIFGTDFFYRYPAFGPLCFTFGGAFNYGGMRIDTMFYDLRAYIDLRANLMFTPRLWLGFGAGVGYNYGMFLMIGSYGSIGSTLPQYSQFTAMAIGEIGFRTSKNMSLRLEYKYEIPFQYRYSPELSLIMDTSKGTIFHIVTLCFDFTY
jgi:TolB-like protein